MFKKLLKNKKAQNTAEYAILISLVVAGIVAMQTYAQRALQARVRDASVYLADQTTELGATSQYEPYYLDTEYNIATSDTQSTYMDNETVGQNSVTDRIREADGRTITVYDTSVVGPTDGGI